MWNIDNLPLVICMSNGMDNHPLQKNRDLISNRLWNIEFGVVDFPPGAVLLWLIIKVQYRKGRLMERDCAQSPHRSDSVKAALSPGMEKARVLAATLVPRPSLPTPRPCPISHFAPHSSVLTKSCVEWCQMPSGNQRKATPASSMVWDT